MLQFRSSDEPPWQGVPPLCSVISTDLVRCCFPPSHSAEQGPYLPGVWKFTKKMNGVQFTFFYENHELVLVLVHNLSMNGRSVHRSFLNFKNEPKFLVPFIATLEDNLFPLLLCFNYNFINYNCISIIISPMQLLKKIRIQAK